MSFLEGIDFNSVVAALVIFGVVSVTFAAVIKIRSKKNNIFEKISKIRAEKKKLRKEKRMEEAKPFVQEVVHTKITHEPEEAVETDHLPSSKQKIDFGVWQGIKFGLGLSIGVTIWIFFLLVSGSALLASTFHSLLGGAPHF